MKSVIKGILSRTYYRIRFKTIKLGKSVYIGRNSFFEGANHIYNNTIFMGELGYASNIAEYCNMRAKVGRYTSIGANVNTLHFSHPSQKFVSTHPAFYSLLKQSGFTYVERQKYREEIYIDEKNKIAVEIGNDVWIGSNVLILGGCKIGDGAIVAAGAVVTRDVEPYEIVGGVPAKTIRYRFSKSDIDKLLAFQWWNKGEKWIRENVKEFEDIDDFRKANLESNYSEKRQI